jgi:putative PIN family toxin of toxin-antitoxin system
VFDTNVVLSALVFRNAATRLRHAWQHGACLPLVSPSTVEELLRVLAYPKFHLSADDQHELLADYLPWTHAVRIPQPPPSIPDCRDPFDAPFLHLAVIGRAKALITGNRDLLALKGKTTFAILTPSEFLAQLRDP